MQEVICNNKKAHHDYFIEESLEAGIVLFGSEVKSCVRSKVDLSDGYVDIINKSKVILKNVHISPDPFSRENHEEKRDRVLLLNKKEILKLQKKIKERGFTLIPMRMYFHETTHKIKVEISLCKGKKQYDKREVLKKKEMNRDIQREGKIR